MSEARITQQQHSRISAILSQVGTTIVVDDAAWMSAHVHASASNPFWKLAETAARSYQLSDLDEARLLAISMLDMNERLMERIRDIEAAAKATTSSRTV